MEHQRATPCGARQAQRAQIVAARMCGVAPHALAEAVDARAVFARQLAMYFTSRVYRVSHARTGAIFGRGRDAASYACRRIEALREDPKIDWQLFEAETLLRAAELVAPDADHAS